MNLEGIGTSNLIVDRSQRLGQGRFGIVYKAKFCGTTVAIKEIKMNPHHRVELLNEIKINEQVRHPNIALFLGHTVHKERRRDVYVLIILEFIQGHTLDTIISDAALRSEFCTPMAKKYDILCELSKAVAYLHCHKMRIAHGDIKPTNVMVTKFGQVKLCDLGLSKMKLDAEHSEISTAHPKGTPMYMSPEQLLDSKRSSTKTDVYSLGVTMFEVLFEDYLYDAECVDDLRKSYQNMEMPRKLQNIQQEPCYSLIQRCLHFEPNARPVALSIVEELEMLSVM